MAQHIEIEFKNLLSKTKYKQLINSLQYKQNTVEQVNHYFDTADHQLQQQKCALRIREKNNRFILTLKEPAQIGSLETNDLIDPGAKNEWLNHFPSPTPHVYKRLLQRKITLSELQYFGYLKTKRTTFHVNEDLTIALDHSFYHDLDDYELEIEATSETLGKKFFQKLLADYSIPVQETKPKIRRFFEHL